MGLPKKTGAVQRERREVRPASGLLKCFFYMHVQYFFPCHLLPLLMHLGISDISGTSWKTFQKASCFYMKSCITCYHHSFQNQTYLVWKDKMYSWWMLLLSASKMPEGQTEKARKRKKDNLKGNARK